ncbi:MAG: Gfo/Idh/MocA family protein [Candidatus Methylacidiphilales bacterium]|nr:Gfo/Idh/MocA family oxidoreductase [Candidatus Methylacidiphilales bacterium]
MNHDIIPFALIGAGGFGKLHLKAILAMEEEGRARLTAVCDPNVHNLGDSTTLLKERGVRLYLDHEEMLSREQDLRAVTIAAPIPYHYRLAKSCLERGLFIYLEKPPVPLLDQLDELIAADAEKRVAVGFQLIDTDWVRQIKQWIVDGSLGDITNIRVTACWPRPTAYYQRAGWAGRMSLRGEPVFDGPATNALSHLLHNIMFFAGTHQHSFAEPSEIRGELYRARPIESYDTVALQGRFGSGMRFSAELTHAGDKALPYRMEITGTKGWARAYEETRALESSLGSQPLNRDTGNALIKTYSQFIDYVNGAVDRPSTTLGDTRGYVLTTNAMLVSSGGIHTIDEAWTEIRDYNDDKIYTVHGLEAALLDCSSGSPLFSEQGLPWASARPETVDTAGLKSSVARAACFKEEIPKISPK